MPRRLFMPKRLLAAVVGVVLLAVVAWWLLAPGEPVVTIGMEGRYQATLPGEPLRAVPYTHGDALAVRIASATETEAGTQYDIRYMAYGPGEHDISRYLVDHNGNQPANLPSMLVSVDALLAGDESGELYDAPQTRIDLHSNDRPAMLLLWGTWGVLLVPLILYGRRPRSRPVEQTPPPTVPERLRALLEAAQCHTLTAGQQADLEKLLLNYWCRRLGVTTTRLVDALEQLRQHPTAGSQVRSVEEWLHQRQGPVNGRVARELLNELGWSGGDSRSGADA